MQKEAFFAESYPQLWMKVWITKHRRTLVKMGKMEEHF